MCFGLTVGWVWVFCVVFLRDILEWSPIKSPQLQNVVWVWLSVL